MLPNLILGGGGMILVLKYIRLCYRLFFKHNRSVQKYYWCHFRSWKCQI